MPDNKIMVGKSGDWIQVKEDWNDTNISLGIDTTVRANLTMHKWEVFQVIRKLAEVSELLTDKTGANGLIISRPANPAEFERADELARKFYSKEYNNVPAEGQYAIDFIVEGEIKRGELG